MTENNTELSLYTMQQDYKKALERIHSILSEYTLRQNNEHIGSGLGGNILYFGYTYGREQVVSYETPDVEFKDGKMMWNPDFLAKDKSEIRKHLDSIIKDRIEKEDFKFILTDTLRFDETFVDEKLKNIDVNSILTGKSKLPDPMELDLGNNLYLCALVCAKYANHLDSGDAQKYSKQFLDIFSAFDTPIVLLAIRIQIGLDRIVKHLLDEDPILGTYLREINSIFKD